VVEEVLPCRAAYREGKPKNQECRREDTQQHSSLPSAVADWVAAAVVEVALDDVVVVVGDVDADAVASLVEPDVVDVVVVVALDAAVPVVVVAVVLGCALSWHCCCCRHHLACWYY